MFDCITIGDTTLDRFLTLPHIPKVDSSTNPGNTEIILEVGAKVPVDQIIESPGGNAYNVAVGLNMLGCDSLLYSYIGDDQNAPLIQRYVTEQGLSTEYITQNLNEMTNSSTILSIQGDRIIFSHHAKRTYTYRDLPEARWIYLTSMGEGNQPIVDQVISKVQGSDTQISFNPGSYMLKHQLDMIRAILPHLDLIFINKEEAQLILKDTTEDIPILVNLLLNTGVSMVALTDASAGAYLGYGDQLYHQSAIGDTIVETTGAGDAFSSGFMAGLIHDISPETALTYGVINSGHVIKEIGSTNGLLTLSQLQEFCAHHPLTPSML